MQKVTDYEQHAAKCRQINMARAWVLLARQAEKNFETKISETVAPKSTVHLNTFFRHN
jgi:hypothetical protein